MLVSGGVCDGSQRQDQVLGDEHTDRCSVGAPDSRTDDEAYGRAIDASDGCADSDADPRATYCPAPSLTYRLNCLRIRVDSNFSRRW